MTPQQKAWIKLICLVLGTGCAACVLSYSGGAKLWVAIIVGIGTGASNVYTALSDSPNDSAKTEPTKTP